MYQHYEGVNDAEPRLAQAKSETTNDQVAARFDALVRKLEEGQDTRYAESLMKRHGRNRLHPQEVAWLESWQATHDNPRRDEVYEDHTEAYDLDVWMGGRDICGARELEEYGLGGGNVAGGWGFRVGTTEDDHGWHRGWWSEVQGLDAFLEAMGQELLPEASEPLGPFYDPASPGADYVYAYRALAIRLLAMLGIVSQIALDANPRAHQGSQQQEDGFERLRERLNR